MTTTTVLGTETKSTYKYDENGRITEYTSRITYGEESPLYLNKDVFAYYTYDANGQIVREDSNQGTRVYSYDSRGNVKSLKQYDFTRGEITESAKTKETIDFEYDNTAWLDKINSVEEIPSVFDSAGNPIKFSECDFKWTNGRQLESIADEATGEILASYTYDENGIRTSKTINGETTYYTTINGRITSQYTINQNSEKINEMEFIYNAENEAVGAIYEGAVYYYIKNALGDVTAIITDEGNYVCQYEYDAWGNPKKHKKYVAADKFAAANPIQYRGYYYDEELGFYYLQSRYYMVIIYRFLNSDLPEYAQMQKDDHVGTNLFAYCCNDPVNNIDPEGYKKKEKNKYDNQTYKTNVAVALIMFLSYYLVPKYLSSKNQFEVSKIIIDETGLCIVKVKYYEKKYNKKSFQLVFGRKTEWKNNKTTDDNLNMNHVMYHSKYITSQGVQLGTGVYVDKANVGAMNISGFVIGGYLFHSVCKASTIKSKYNKVWGKKGYDSKNKNLYYLFNISKDNKLNGWYACCMNPKAKNNPIYKI